MVLLNKKRSLKRTILKIKKKLSNENYTDAAKKPSKQTFSNTVLTLIRKIYSKDPSNNPKDITLDTNITKGSKYHLDKLDRVELVIDIEEKLNIKLDTDAGWFASKCDNATTIKELVDVLYSCISEK